MTGLPMLMFLKRCATCVDDAGLRVAHHNVQFETCSQTTEVEPCNVQSLSFQS